MFAWDAADAMGIMGYNMDVIAIHGPPYVFGNFFSPHGMMMDITVQAGDRINMTADGSDVMLNHDHTHAGFVA